MYNLTKRKQALLDEVYLAWKDMVKVKKPYAKNREMYPNLHSKYWSQAAMCQEPNDPIYLDTQHMLKVVKTHNKIQYFARIVIRPRLFVWCPLKTKQVIDGKVLDSKLLKRDRHYELHLSISKEVELNSNPSAILSVDMGEKVIATAVLWHRDSRTSNQSKPIFMGRKARGLRRHYAYLRKILGEKKLLRVIKRLGSVESRKINDIFHKISRELVSIAKASNAVILLGDLSGLRERTKKGKKMNRIVHDMPYARLTKYISYKANWDGIPVLTGSERYSSKTCSKCGSTNTTRPHQGLFKCRTCGCQLNADYNGATNLAQRLADYMFVSGVIGFSPVKQNDFLDSASEIKVIEPRRARV